MKEDDKFVVAAGCMVLVAVTWMGAIITVIVLAIIRFS